MHQLSRHLRADESPLSPPEEYEEPTTHQESQDLSIDGGTEEFARVSRGSRKNQFVRVFRGDSQFMRMLRGDQQFMRMLRGNQHPDQFMRIIRGDEQLDGREFNGYMRLLRAVHPDQDQGEQKQQKFLKREFMRIVRSHSDDKPVGR